MCGIAGEISWEGVTDAVAMGSLVSRLAHRGPDDRGTWTSPDARCLLGHTRLSVIDLSAAAHQPMVDPETGNAIVFNGEIYNFSRQRGECERRGYRFRSHSDTEVILALYRYFGQECVHRLRGMFAFAIWDAANQRLFMARDRVGKKPLNYALTRNGLLFSSEIGPLARHPAVAGSLDIDALDLYFQLQFIPAPWTVYREIRKLPPAHFAIYDRNGLSLKQYWDVDYHNKISISEENALDALEEKFSEAVRIRMVSDVPLGALLSGGVDSSLVVATMARLSGAPVRTFSIGFTESQFDELPYAKIAAETCRTEHHPETVTAKLEQQLPLIALRYGEPYADSSALPSFAVCRMARNYVTVAMNGDGGDELLGGYPRYSLSRWKLLSWLVYNRIFSPMRGDPVPRLLAESASFSTRLQRYALRHFAHSEAQSLVMYRSFWNDAERGRLLGRDPASSVVPAWRAAWFDAAPSHADNPVDRMLWMESRTYLPGDLLVKMDIASMHCGLETRSPFLDHELIEFCAKLPLNHKVHNREGKYLLKQLAARFFPKEFVYRPKMGFGIPLMQWLRGPLKPTVCATLGDPGTMAPLNTELVGHTLREFMDGDDNQGNKIWTLLMFGMWKQYCASP